MNVLGMKFSQHNKMVRANKAAKVNLIMSSAWPSHKLRIGFLYSRKRSIINRKATGLVQ